MGRREQLIEEIHAKAKAIKDAVAPYEANDQDVPTEKYAEILALTNDLKDLRKSLQGIDGAREAGSEAASLLDLLANPTGKTLPHAASGEAGASAGLNRGGQIKTIGQMIAESDQYKRFMSAYAPKGIIGEQTRVHMEPVAIPSKTFGRGQKALLTGASDTAAGALVFNDVQDGLLGLGRRTLTIRDLVTNGETDSDTVEYVRVTSETNAAAPVAEATAISGTSGTKPESSMAFEKVTTPVKTIAHWMPATRRALSDAGQLRTLIDNFLEYGLEEELEDQMVSGDGTGENLTGIATVTGVQTQAYDTNLLTTTRKARTKVRTGSFRGIPTAYALNPADWEAIDLLQDNENRYYFGGPARMGIPTLWGLPVVESEAVPAGTGYVADWRQAVLWDREEAQIMVSDSHSDFFIRNLIAILAEMRAAFGVMQPSAFVEIALAAA